LGAHGVATGFETAKYLGDAWTGYSCGFFRDMLRLIMVNLLGRGNLQPVASGRQVMPTGKLESVTLFDNQTFKDLKKGGAKW